MIWGDVSHYFRSAIHMSGKLGEIAPWFFFEPKVRGLGIIDAKRLAKKGWIFSKDPKFNTTTCQKVASEKNAVAAKTEHTSNLSIKTHRRFGENKGFDPTVEGFGDKKGEANQPRFKFSSGTLMYLFNTTKSLTTRPWFSWWVQGRRSGFLPMKFFSGTFQHLLLLNFGGIQCLVKIWEDPFEVGMTGIHDETLVMRSDLMKTLGFLNLLDVSFSTRKMYQARNKPHLKTTTKTSKIRFGDFCGEKNNMEFPTHGGLQNMWWCLAKW